METITFFSLYFALLLYVNFASSIPEYKWSPLDKKKGQNASDFFSNRHVLASDMIGGHPVYISLTTISDRISLVAGTVSSILRGEVLPTHVYVMVSKEPYMKDNGIEKADIPKDLVRLTETSPVSIIYTENIGPHRKLLPILAKFWNDDCLIVTIDDDVVYAKRTLSELIKYYILSGRDSVIALRSHRIGLCTGQGLAVADYKHWPIVGFGIREMLQLPTGTGGILYQPDFFHPIVFDKRFIDVTKTGDDIMFRLATMIKDVPVVTACRVSRQAGGVRSCPETYLIKNPGGLDRLSSRGVSTTRHRQLSQFVNASADVSSSVPLEARYYVRESNELNHAKPSVLLTHNCNGSGPLTILNNVLSNSLQRSSNITDLDMESEHNHNRELQRQRQLRGLKDSPHSSSYRKVSLWSANKQGRNNVMWNAAVRFIENTLEINFYSIYNFYYLKERKECLRESQAKRYACGLVSDCDEGK